MNFLDSFLSQVRDSGYKIDTVYDIGAYIGEFSKKAQEYLPNAEYHLFEPNPKHNDWSKGLGTLHNIYLADVDSKAEFWSDDTTGDSFYKEFTGIHNNLAPKYVDTVTLDGYIKQNNIRYPDLIKLDTQGSEIDILEGGAECLSNATFIIMECPVITYNIGAPSLDSYNDFMLKNNYLPIEVTEVHYINGVVCQLDFAYINKKKAGGQ